MVQCRDSSQFGDQNGGDENQDPQFAVVKHLTVEICGQATDWRKARFLEPGVGIIMWVRISSEKSKTGDSES